MVGSGDELVCWIDCRCEDRRLGDYAPLCKILTNCGTLEVLFQGRLATSKVWPDDSVVVGLGSCLLFAADMLVVWLLRMLIVR